MLSKMRGCRGGRHPYGEMRPQSASWRPRRGMVIGEVAKAARVLLFKLVRGENLIWTVVNGAGTVA
jgi:hypothetical protein